MRVLLTDFFFARFMQTTENQFIFLQAVGFCWLVFTPVVEDDKRDEESLNVHLQPGTKLLPLSHPLRAAVHSDRNKRSSGVAPKERVKKRRK